MREEARASFAREAWIESTYFRVYVILTGARYEKSIATWPPAAAASSASDDKECISGRQRQAGRTEAPGVARGRAVRELPCAPRRRDSR